MRLAHRAPVLVLGVVLVLLATATCGREAERCFICDMVIPDDTRAAALIDGRPRAVCDPRCAITFREQTHRPVRLERVTDFRTRTPLDPRRAVYVTGSDVAPDTHTAVLRGWPSTTAPLHWHRCLPSVLAFRSAEEASGFLQHHGGRLARLPDLGFADHTAH